MKLRSTAPGPAGRARIMAVLLAAACLVSSGSPAQAGVVGSGHPAGAGAAARIVGTWRAAGAHELFIFKPNGELWTCDESRPRAQGQRGQWRLLASGRFEVKFTHTTVTNCALTVFAQHAVKVPITGGATVDASGLAVYTSGEGPPDRYLRLPGR
jgi:hypothetical protein